MVGMTDIAQFLAARLDEDEAIALAVEDNSAPFIGEWINDDNRALRTRNRWVLAYKPDAEPWRPGVLDHIARHDPARVLREVAAKRALLQRLDEDTDACTDDAEWRGASSIEWQVLVHLAAPYADHPDYNPAWRIQ